MSIKKLIYQIIRIPLIIIFIKTPLLRILKYRFKKHRSLKNIGIFGELLDYIFWKEYYSKLTNPEKIRELTNSTLIEGEGRKWAQLYYDKHFQTLEKLKKTRCGTMPMDEAKGFFYTEIINHIKSNSLDNDKHCYIIQVGSASGRDLEFFYKLFPNINYISTDVNDEILNFQKEKYNYKNFYFFKCYAEEIDKCIEKYSLNGKKIIIFTSASLNYVNPYFLEIFFKKLKVIKNLNVFIAEPVDLRFIDKNLNKSENRGNISFSHAYGNYAKDFKILNDKVIRPYNPNGPHNKHTGQYYIHLRT